MQIGVVGIGLMGNPIAHRLLECNHQVVAYNRTVEKTASLKAAGAYIASDMSDLLKQCEVVLLTLTDANAIAELLFNNSFSLAGKTIVQMGTISPHQSQSIQKSVVEADGTYLEAPVLGSIPEAKAGTLLVMVGSTPSDFERMMPVLKNLGSTPRHVGPVGSAAALKLSLNQLIGALTTAFSTSLEFGQRYDVPTDLFMEILRDSALYAPTFDKKLQRIQDKNFANPNFPTKHLLKDMTLFSEAAGAVNIDTAMSNAIRALIKRAMKSYSDQDYSAISTAVSE